VASGITIQVQGLAGLQKKMGKLPEVLVERLDANMRAVGDDYVLRVEEATHVGLTGVLKGRTSNKRIAVLNYEIVNNVHYAPYVEFGTVSYVSVPAELQAYAMQFKGQGIIKNGGMRARPFFFPHIPWAIGELNKQLAAAVKVALSK
jgi:hypothetical protein